MNTEGEMINVLGDKFSEKYHSRVKYVLIICNHCYKTWGITPTEDGLISERQLVCRNCAGDLVFEQIMSK